MATIINAYGSGRVTGGRNTGGLVGTSKQSTTIRNSFYNMNTTGQSDTGKGVGKSSEEMSDRSTYRQWNMSRIWTIKDGRYPILQWQ